jgi:hypothetical protein
MPCHNTVGGVYAFLEMEVSISRVFIAVSSVKDIGVVRFSFTFLVI